MVRDGTRVGDTVSESVRPAPKKPRPIRREGWRGYPTYECPECRYSVNAQPRKVTPEEAKADVERHIEARHGGGDEEEE